MKKWIFIGIVALGVIGIGYVIWDYNRPSIRLDNIEPDSIVISPNPWQEYISIPAEDTGKVFEVTWDQKYGATRREFCRAIFKNDKSMQYKLVAPWITSIIIQLSNTNNIKIVKINKNEIPKNYSSEKSKE